MALIYTKIGEKEKAIPISGNNYIIGKHGDLYTAPIHWRTKEPEKGKTNAQVLIVNQKEKQLAAISEFEALIHSTEKAVTEYWLHPYKPRHQKKNSIQEIRMFHDIPMLMSLGDEVIARLPWYVSKLQKLKLKTENQIEQPTKYLISGEEEDLFGLGWKLKGALWSGTVGLWLLWLAAALTLITGWDYFRAGIAHMEH